MPKPWNSLLTAKHFPVKGESLLPLYWAASVTASPSCTTWQYYSNKQIEIHSFFLSKQSAIEQLNCSTWRTACLTLINTRLASPYPCTSRSVSAIRNRAHIPRLIYLSYQRRKTFVNFFFLNRHRLTLKKNKIKKISVYSKYFIT